MRQYNRSRQKCIKTGKPVRYVLRIIMDDEELTVIDNEVQMDFKNMLDRPY